MAGDHLKRLALQIAAQMPEDDAEALYVLDLTREIVKRLGAAVAVVPIRPLSGESRVLRVVPGGAAADPLDHPDKSSQG